MVLLSAEVISELAADQTQDISTSLPASCGDKNSVFILYTRAEILLLEQLDTSRTYLC